MSKKNSDTFQASFERLRKIIDEIERNDSLDVEELVEKIRESAHLLKFCKGKLKAADIEIEKICADLETEFEDKKNPPEK